MIKGFAKITVKNDKGEPIRKSLDCNTNTHVGAQYIIALLNKTVNVSNINILQVLSDNRSNYSINSFSVGLNDNQDSQTLYTIRDYCPIKKVDANNDPDGVYIAGSSIYETEFDLTSSGKVKILTSDDNTPGQPKPYSVDTQTYDPTNEDFHFWKKVDSISVQVGQDNTQNDCATYVLKLDQEEGLQYDDNGNPVSTTINEFGLFLTFTNDDGSITSSITDANNNTVKVPPVLFARLTQTYSNDNSKQIEINWTVCVI